MAGIFSGDYLNRDDDLVNVKLVVNFRDASGSELSPESSGKLANGERFTVRQHVTCESWVRVMSSSFASQLPFTIKEIAFSPQSGQVVSGVVEVNLDGQSKACDLVVDEAHEAEAGGSLQFEREKSFRLQLVPLATEKGKLPEPIATIEGCSLNDPFNCLIVG